MRSRAPGDEQEFARSVEPVRKSGLGLGLVSGLQCYPALTQGEAGKVRLQTCRPSQEPALASGTGLISDPPGRGSEPFPSHTPLPQGPPRASGKRKDFMKCRSWA